MDKDLKDASGFKSCKTNVPSLFCRRGLVEMIESGVQNSNIHEPKAIGSEPSISYSHFHRPFGDLILSPVERNRNLIISQSKTNFTSVWKITISAPTAWANGSFLVIFVRLTLGVKVIMPKGSRCKHQLPATRTSVKWMKQFKRKGGHSNVGR